LKLPTRITLWILLAALPAIPLQAQTGAADGVSRDRVEQALKAIQDQTEISEEERNELSESYRRTLSYLKDAEKSAARQKSYDIARGNAPGEAADLRGKLERSSRQEKPTAPDSGLSLDDLDQVIQSDRADLAAAESSLSETQAANAKELERPVKVRERLAELKQRDAELAADIQSATGEDTTGGIARSWLLAANAAAVKAEIAALTAEQLSRPMRQELLKARQDLDSHTINRLKEKIEVYEAAAGELRKQAAAKAQSQALSEQAELADRNPVVQALAERNTVLTAHTTKLTGELEVIRGQSRQAETRAQRYEEDLESSRRKLEVVGMSQAMGQVLREQQARLPRARYSRSDAQESGARISASSLRVLEYQDERRRLRNPDTYIVNLTRALPEAEATQATPDLQQLASRRVELLERALEVENTYLRAMGELDFNNRRLQQAAEEYNSFISQRLMWIRSSSPLSLNTLAELPGHVAVAFSPSAWLDLLRWFILDATDSPVTMLLALGFALLIILRPRFSRMVRETASVVGNVDRDSIVFTARALLLTLLLALPWPYLLFASGLVAGTADPDLALAGAASTALMRISYYFLGIELLRKLVMPEGVMHRHFHWSEDALRAVGHRLFLLECIFVPAGGLAIFSTYVSGAQVDTILTDLALIIALGALVLFYLRVPRLFHSSLENWAQISGRQRKQSTWGRRAVRAVLIGLPCLLILSVAAGYTNTAVRFMVLLLLTNVLFIVVMLVQDFGLRWLRILHRRLVRSRRRKELEAARARRESAEGAEQEEFETGEPDPDAIDDNARKLLSTTLTAIALLGMLGIWGSVLPALGILQSFELWQRTEIVDGGPVNVAVTLADLAWALVLGFLGYVAIQRVPSLLEVILRQRLKVATGTAYAAVTLFRYTLIAAVAIAVIAMLGGRWSQIQWAVAGLGVGIGFGLQEVVANFICGLIILFEQPIRVGDTVTVGQTSGTVTRIRMRATTIRDWDRFELLVPNKEFITGRLLNWSLSDALNRIVINVGVAYGSNLRQAMDIALGVAHDHPMVVADPEPFITFDDFGDNSLMLSLRCYLNSVENRITTASEVRTIINDRFNEAGIVVAFPQRDVHLDARAPLEVIVRPADPAAPTTGA
jgi:potassium efflux system protein